MSWARLAPADTAVFITRRGEVSASTAAETSAKAGGSIRTLVLGAPPPRRAISCLSVRSQLEKNAEVEQAVGGQYISRRYRVVNDVVEAIIMGVPRVSQLVGSRTSRNPFWA